MTVQECKKQNTCRLFPKTFPLISYSLIHIANFCKAVFRVEDVCSPLQAQCVKYINEHQSRQMIFFSFFHSNILEWMTSDAAFGIPYNYTVARKVCQIFFSLDNKFHDMFRSFRRFLSCPWPTHTS